MPLNPATIYRRTDEGLREVYEKSHQFTQSERLVLILLDGRLSIGGLRARLPSLDGDRIERTLTKLEEAGLVEPLRMAEEVQSPARAEEVMLLEPDVVAHFLEQGTLDPQTSSGTRRDEGAGTLALGVDRTASHVLRHEPRSRAEDGESGRLHFLPPDENEWQPTEATAFAITTVNVPDRLDMQEERDRVEAEEYEGQRRRAQVRLWMKRLLLAVVAIVIGVVIYAVLRPLLDAVTPRRVAERLSAGFQRPVKVAETEFRLAPSPRLIVRGIDVGGEFAASEAALLINWRDFWRALNGGPWAWGEARIAPLSMSPAQALAALRLLPGAAEQWPPTVSTVRIESIRVEGSRMFPGQYEATFRRGDDGRLAPLVVKPLGNEAGQMQVEFRRAAGDPAAVDFALEARGWSMPLVASTRWNEVRANGRLTGNILEISSFTLVGFYGITTGTVFLAGDVEWAITGRAEAANIDVETALKSFARRGQVSPEAMPAALQGTANLNLFLAGRGATPEEAIERSSVAGPFSVRFATLNGINLGLAATQGTGATGSTRFTEFGGFVASSGTSLRFEETGGRAGSMLARANFTVAPDTSVAGTVRIEFGGRRAQAPVSLRLSGTTVTPRFGR